MAQTAHATPVAWISAAYAAVGGWLVHTGSFLLAFAGSILIPAALWLMVKSRQPAR